MMFSTLGMMQ